jgi:hypothetical protein
MAASEPRLSRCASFSSQRHPSEWEAERSGFGRTRSRTAAQASAWQHTHALRDKGSSCAYLAGGGARTRRAASAGAVCHRHVAVIQEARAGSRRHCGEGASLRSLYTSPVSSTYLPPPLMSVRCPLLPFAGFAAAAGVRTQDRAHFRGLRTLSQPPSIASWARSTLSLSKGAKQALTAVTTGFHPILSSCRADDEDDEDEDSDRDPQWSASAVVTLRPSGGCSSVAQLGTSK